MNSILNISGLPTSLQLKPLIQKDWETFLAAVEKGIEEENREYEKRIYSTFAQLEEKEWLQKWEFFKDFLSKNYVLSELNLSFYENELKNLQSQTSPPISLQKQSESLDTLRQHLLQSWAKALEVKEERLKNQQLEEHLADFKTKIKAKITQFELLEEVLEEVTQEADKLWDLSDSTWEMSDFKEFGVYAAFLQKNPELRKLAELLGNLRNSSRKTFEMVPIPDAQIRYAVKSSITGVRQSDDLGSLLPSEIALLADKTTEGLFIKRLAEKKLQCYDYKTNLLGYEKTFKREQPDLEKGPFIICMDTSGSMEGMPETVAKALTLAIIKMFVQTARKCYLIAFSNQIQTLEISSLKGYMPELLRFLKHAFRGGTDLTPAIEEALRMLRTQQYEKADILLISDFLLPKLNYNTLKAIEIVKVSKTKLYSLLISKQRGFTIPPKLAGLLDKVWQYEQEGIVELTIGH